VYTAQPNERNHLEQQSYLGMNPLFRLPLQP